MISLRPLYVACFLLPWHLLFGQEPVYDLEGSKSLLRLGKHEQVISRYQDCFKKKTCSHDELKLYAAACLQDYASMVITGRLVDRVFGDWMLHATKALESVLSAEPEDPEGTFLVGIREKLLNHDSTAEMYLRKVYQHNPRFQTYAFLSVEEELRIVLKRQQKWTTLETLLDSLPRGAWRKIEMSLIKLETGQVGRSWKLFMEGLEALADSEQIQSLYCDIEMLLDQHDLERWQSLPDWTQKKQFIKSFWFSRAPNPMDTVNHRFVEHYRRLAYARDHFPKKAKPWCDDRGLVYIRMGQPDRVLYGDYDQSWFYDHPSAFFDFVERGGFYVRGTIMDASGTSSNPAQAFAKLKAFVDSRKDYHPYYQKLSLRMQAIADARVSRGVGQDLAYFRNHTNQIQQELIVRFSNIQEIPERFEYDSGAPHLPLNATLSQFKEDGKSRLDVAYMIPLSEVIFTASGSYLMTRAMILDSLYNPVYRFEKEYRLASGLDTMMSSLVDEFRASLYPGRYVIVMDVRNNETSKIGIYKMHVDVMDFSNSNLILSEIQVASRIEAGVDGSFVKPHTNLMVVPNPASKTVKTQPLRIYFEIYNLVLDNDGHSQYEVTYQISERKSRNVFSKLTNLFSRKEYHLSQTTVRRGNTTRQSEYIGFDISELSQSNAVLQVRVKDLLSKQVATSFLELSIQNR